jgi:hypothetical protein
MVADVEIWAMRARRLSRVVGTARVVVVSFAAETSYSLRPLGYGQRLFDAKAEPAADEEWGLKKREVDGTMALTVEDEVPT